ncbi:MAG: YkgJ family cysteine cluster protein [Deltaproteobacteria bacterium]|nr:YkgJ family cysteine cluster protein [Deltaproteobacteria bacterium]MBW2302112.1 YkgJ family cysteine cluster protein [Deltaproteobacteria bacterium]
MLPRDPQPRDHCIRCGKCCLASSPSLHRKDLGLLRDGLLGMRDLFTIRKGEAVFDNIHEKVTITSHEMVKIREKEGIKGGCCFYQEETRSCRIYDHRPLQCSVLKCWDTRELETLLRERKITREMIVKDGTLLALIREHERRCDYSLLEDRVRCIESEGEKAVRDVLELLRFDYHFRLLIPEKLPVHPLEMDFLFGRPLTETIRMYGLQVQREEDGSFLLTTVSPAPWAI